MEETGLSIGSAPQTRTGEQRKIKENEGKMAHSSGHLSFEEAAERAKKREREKKTGSCPHELGRSGTRDWLKWPQPLDSRCLFAFRGSATSAAFSLCLALKEAVKRQ